MSDSYGFFGVKIKSDESDAERKKMIQENAEALSSVFDFKKPREDEYNRCVIRIGELKEKINAFEADMDRATKAFDAAAYSQAKQAKAPLLDEIEMLEKHCKKLISTDFGMHE